MYYKELCYKKVALYIRCSHEEQVKFGETLESQKSDLLDFANRHNMEVIDVYADEGTTARKSLYKRKNFQRMISDVQDGKIEVIVFKCLDRWVRNVADYYKIQEILDKHNVVWATTTERYETLTANGRLQLNIKLSIAQDEADRTSERIKYVFEHKVAKGEAISGSLPYGLMIDDNKHVIPDPEKTEIVQFAFEQFYKTRSKRGTYNMIRERYGVNFCDATFRRMLHNPLYIGEYRGNHDYCPAIIDKNIFNEVQKIMKKGYVKQYKKNEYIFTGMIECGECHHLLNARSTKGFAYYRCSQYVQRKLCTHKHGVSEKKLESYLLENIENEINKYIVQFEIKKGTAKQRPAFSLAAIKEKKKRLQQLYVSGYMELDDFKIEYNKLEEKEKNYTVENYNTVSDNEINSLRNFLKSDFKTLYDGLQKSEKRIFWQSIIKKIVAYDNGSFDIFF